MDGGVGGGGGKMFLRHLEKSISVFPQSLSSQERNTYKEYNSQVRNVFDL